MQTLRVVIHRHIFSHIGNRRQPCSIQTITGVLVQQKLAPMLARQLTGRLQTREGKAVYATRKSTVETVFGIIKQVQGFRQFLLRGLDAVQGEWSLVCIGWNLKRMHALRG